MSMDKPVVNTIEYPNALESSQNDMFALTTLLTIRENYCIKEIL